MKKYCIIAIIALTLASCGGNKGTESETTGPEPIEKNSTGTNTTGMDSAGKSNGATTGGNTSGGLSNGTNATGTTNAGRGSSDTNAVGTNKNMGKGHSKIDSTKIIKDKKY